MDTPISSVQPAAPSPSPQEVITPSTSPPAAPIADTSKKTTASKEPKVKKKPGNPGDFQGSREALLLSLWPEYVKASKNKQLAKFWQVVWEKFFGQFDWRLDLKEEPDPTAVRPSDTNLSPEEEKRKESRVKGLKTKIKSWYNHRRGGAGMAANPWTPILAALGRKTGPQPKRMADYQLYMQMDEFKDRVVDKLTQDFPNVPREEALAARCKVARELLAAEPQDVKDRVRQAADDEHAVEIEAWREANDGLPSPADVDQAEARARFAPLVLQLLTTLRAYTGYYVTMVYGREVEGKFQVGNFHVGKIDSADSKREVDFQSWDREGYQKVSDQFIRFLTATTGRDPDSPGAVPPVIMSTSSDAPAAPAPRARPPAPVSVPTASVPTASSAATAPSTSIVPAMTPSDATSPGTPAGDAPEATWVLVNPVTARPVTPPRAMPSEPATTSDTESGDDLERRMQGLAILTSPLHEELAALAPAKRLERVASLERMNRDRLQRVNNIAKIHRSLKAVNADDTIAMDEDPDFPVVHLSPMKKGSKRTSENAKNGNAKRRRRATRSDDESDESESSDGEVPRREEPPKTRGRKQTSGAQPAGTGSQAALIKTKKNGEGATKENAEVPKWVSKGRETLEAGTDDWNGGWNKLVVLWWSLETSTKFASSPRVGLPTAERPAEIPWWTSRARSGNPTISNVENFVAVFKNWWFLINPSWRQNEDGSLKLEEDGSWEELRKPGANGLLNVLICLKWWRERMDGLGWDDVVADVTWVIECLLKTTTGTSSDNNSVAVPRIGEVGLPAPADPPGPGARSEAVANPATASAGKNTDVVMSSPPTTHNSPATEPAAPANTAINPAITTISSNIPAPAHPALEPDNHDAASAALFSYPPPPVLAQRVAGPAINVSIIAINSAPPAPKESVLQPGNGGTADDMNRCVYPPPAHAGAAPKRPRPCCD
ncbi:hypothetical protein C8R43DRAFT_1123523 [Mycena crocata]|nr:hypothetical protein C8R43DRAFT_1123523 [Mycena crocata]